MSTSVVKVDQFADLARWASGLSDDKDLAEVQRALHQGELRVVTLELIKVMLTSRRLLNVAELVQRIDNQLTAILPTLEPHQLLAWRRQVTDEMEKHLGLAGGGRGGSSSGVTVNVNAIQSAIATQSGASGADPASEHRIIQMVRALKSSPLVGGSTDEQ